MAGVKRQKKKGGLRFRERVGVAVFGTILVLCVLIVGTVAYLQREAKLVNTFEVGTVQTEVSETFQDNVKSNVILKNTGTEDAYLRAKVLIYYEDNEGKIIGDIPQEGRDYEIVWGEDIDTQWLKDGSGYYYYKNPVKCSEKNNGVSGETSVLIKRCQTIQAGEEKDRHLVVDILSQAIQADPAAAVEDAWGSQVVVKEDGTLGLKQGN